MQNPNKKIKVAFLVPLMEMGGAERCVLNIIKGLDKNKFEVSLVLAKRVGPLIKEIPPQTPVFDFKTTHVRNILLKLVKYLKQEKPDIVLSAISHINFVSILAIMLSGTKTKLVVTERTTFSRVSATVPKLSHRLIARFVFPVLMKLFYLRADSIVGVSKGVARDLSKIIGESDKITFIYNPLNIELISKLSEDLPEYPFIRDPRIPVILAAGRLVRAKDYPTMIKAFSLVCKEKPSYLVILGVGEEKGNLEKLAGELGIESRVFLLGVKNNPYGYMADADVFVLSSTREGFPNVIVESMACGTPVISTDCQSGPNEIIENGRNGLLVPMGDEKALAQALLKVINDDKLREKFSSNGKIAAQKFSFQRSIDCYEGLFISLMNRK
jgi:glycosyltransferase involved in cell wall biosynthesis